MITPESSIQEISQIQRIVSVKSPSDWAHEEQHSHQKSKKAKAARYFCEFGFYERTQTKTAAFDWAEFYTAADKDDLVGFQEKVEATVMEAARSKLSSKLGSKIGMKKREKIVYVEKAEESDFDSGTESAGMTDSSTDQYQISAWTKSSTTRQKASHNEDVYDLEPDEYDLMVPDPGEPAPRTPRKRKPVSSMNSPRTPKTPKRFTKISTPGSRSYRVQAPLEVTPLPSRVRALANESNLSPHQLARQRLHVAEVPTSLPCREEEFASIFEQVESAILENESALIYVSGTPGTGKTATVREVINALQYRVAEEELFPFKFVEINGMKIPDPTQAYSKLWETLTGQRVTPNHALSLLQLQFSTSNPSRMPCVVLMDELDQLTTMKQEVMYNFFQWPNMPNTRLIVVAVANTMDLPERTLAHKVSSRLGLTRIAFAAYTRPQLNEIIKSRLSSVDSIEVEEAAIDYACLRVSRVSGDARRALDICRRAFEIAEPGFDTAPRETSTTTGSTENAHGKITMAVMKKAFDEMTSSPLQLYLKTLPFASKVFLKALLSCLRRSGLSECALGDVIEESGRLCKMNTHPDLHAIMGPMQPLGMHHTARALETGGLLHLEQTRSERGARTRLKIMDSELLSAWSEDSELCKIT